MIFFFSSASFNLYLKAQNSCSISTHHFHLLISRKQKKRKQQQQTNKKNLTGQKLVCKPHLLVKVSESCSFWSNCVQLNTKQNNKTKQNKKYYLAGVGWVGVRNRGWGVHVVGGGGHGGIHSVPGNWTQEDPVDVRLVKFGFVSLLSLNHSWSC